MSGPRLIAQVCFGPARGAKVAVAPGQTLTVGRAPECGLALPHDELLANVHLELHWDGVHARVRHVGGGDSYTCLAGQVVSDAPLAHGAWLRAGGTDLRVHVEARTRPTSARDSAAAARAETALTALQRVPGPLYAVLDLARDERLPVLLRESAEPAMNLFDGVEGERLAQVSPHLVALPDGGRLAADLVREGHGLRWGVFLVGKTPLAELRRHLRKFLLAHLAGTAPGEKVFFRWYDPGVLQVYLQSCDPGERAAWFADAIALAMGEDEAASDGWWRATVGGVG